MVTNGMPVLQVRVSEGQMEVLKAHARKHGATMTEVVGLWIDRLGRGGGVGEVTSGASSGVSSSEQWSGDGAVLAELQKQTELLRQLLNNGAGSSAADAPTRMGGDEVGEEGRSGSRDEESEEGFSSYAARLRARSVVVSEEE
jgi:hypothetical protein